ncbi:MAG TPA: tetratricopeptide repeat protein, partial [Burkholderiaceae bacterium]|nr:tetratricopeptide repeat protein [Burkholderiaceae bacterium]
MNRLRAAFALAAAIALLVFGSAHAAASAPRHTESFVRPVSLTNPTSETSDLFERLGDAAEDGDVDAMNLLGVLFVTNARAPSDYSMALYWFQRAVDAGSVDGMDNLATMYLRGLGVAPDYVNAFRWFQRAAEGGNASAMFSVAAMAEHGLGAARDLALARRMYRKAAESGLPLAMLWLSDNLARNGPDQNLVEAHAWLDVAALAQLDGQLHLVILARREDLGSRL